MPHPTWKIFSTRQSKNEVHRRLTEGRKKKNFCNSRALPPTWRERTVSHHKQLFRNGERGYLERKSPIFIQIISRQNSWATSTAAKSNASPGKTKQGKTGKSQWTLSTTPQQQQPNTTRQEPINTTVRKHKTNQDGTPRCGKGSRVNHQHASGTSQNPSEPS